MGKIFQNRGNYRSAINSYFTDPRPMGAKRIAAKLTQHFDLNRTEYSALQRNVSFCLTTLQNKYKVSFNERDKDKLIDLVRLNQKHHNVQLKEIGPSKKYGAFLELLSWLELKLINPTSIENTVYMDHLLDNLGNPFTNREINNNF